MLNRVRCKLLAQQQHVFEAFSKLAKYLTREIGLGWERAITELIKGEVLHLAFEEGKSAGFEQRSAK